MISSFNLNLYAQNTIERYTEMRMMKWMCGDSLTERQPSMRLLKVDPVHVHNRKKWSTMKISLQHFDLI